ncbi:MAG: sugar transporter permease [Polaromonas sp.]|nr:sugar transporter permease [Polaromonas sp.]
MGIAIQAYAPAHGGGRQTFSRDQFWGLVMVVPYVAVFLMLVVYPVGYGLYLGSDADSYRRLFNDPAYWQTVRNTLVFLLVAVNIKLFAALLISGFFLNKSVWVRVVALIFVLPWAVPSFISILSFRWMLNAEWGMLNGLIFKLTGSFGYPWLLDKNMALGWIIVVHIWKWLPFWTLIMLAGRLAIPTDLYEAAEMDGATGLQKFRFVTVPSIAALYFTSTVLSTIWSLGDFNSVYLLTGGGPGDNTHLLATLGIRYGFGQNDVGTATASVITALPLLVPLVIVMLHWIRKQEAAR